MPIQRNNNKETDLIIGHNFPTDNEETFASDATYHRQFATNMRDLDSQMEHVQQQVAERMSGQTATAYQDKLAQHRTKVQNAADEHDNIAAGLEATAANIATSKSNMNHIDDQFHTNMNDLQTWGVDNRQPQEEMNNKRTELVDQAHSQIKSTSTELSSVQNQVAGDLAQGKTINTSNVSLPLSDGAKSTDIIANKGAGFTPLASSQASTATSSTTPGGNYTSIGAKPGAQRFNSTGLSTSVSSAGSATLDRTTPSAGMTGGAIPMGLAGATGAGSQANNSSAQGGVVPGMAGAAAGTAATGTTTGGAASTAATGTNPHRAGASSTSTGTHFNRDNVPEEYSAWTDAEINMMRVALTIYKDLMDFGWETGVALARVKENDTVSLVWATDLGAAFIPDTIHTTLARPIDLSAVDGFTRDMMCFRPASETLDMYLASVNASVAEKVVVGSIGGAVSGYRIVDNVRVAQLLEQGAQAENGSVDSASLLPSIAGQGDASDDAHRIVSKHLDHTLESALTFARFAATGATRSKYKDMPDGTDLSAGSYCLQAIARLLEDHAESGVGVNNLVWQAELFERVA